MSAPMSLSSPIGPPVADVHLSRSPLARVIVQLRFASLAKLATGGKYANLFIDSLSDEYPYLDQSHDVALRFEDGKVKESEGGERIWTLKDSTGEWQVLLSPSFVALQTSRYVSREDFSKRLAEVIGTFATVVASPRIERFGVRYSNQLSDPGALRRLPELVRPEVLGILGSLGPDADLPQSLTESHFNTTTSDEIDGGVSGLIGRWGTLPPGAVLTDDDPAACSTLDAGSRCVSSRLDGDGRRIAEPAVP
jgi:uncharacterized protein (TIGR04255 family)